MRRFFRKLLCFFVVLTVFFQYTVTIPVYAENEATTADFDIVPILLPATETQAENATVSPDSSTEVGNLTESTDIICDLSTSDQTAEDSGSQSADSAEAQTERALTSLPNSTSESDILTQNTSESV